MTYVYVAHVPGGPQKRGYDTWDWSQDGSEPPCFRGTEAGSSVSISALTC